MSRPTDNVVLAVMFSALNALMLSIMNMFAKILGEYFPAEQITFFRSFVAIIILLAGLVVMRKLPLLKTARPFAHMIRAAAGTIGIFLGVWAYMIMPMANATTLIFTQPLWVVLLSYPLLRERVGIYRVVAVAIGFCGVLVIAGSPEDFTPFTLMVGLVAGLFNALVAICLRWLGHTENAAATVFYFVLFGSIVMGGFLPFTGVEIPPVNTGMILLFILALGGFGLASLLAKTYSYQLGAAALVTPVGYSMIIWAGLFDYLIWDRTPSFHLVLGALIIVGSNLFILWREKTKQIG